MLDCRHTQEVGHIVVAVVEHTVAAVHTGVAEVGHIKVGHKLAVPAAAHTRAG